MIRFIKFLTLLPLVLIACSNAYAERPAAKKHGGLSQESKDIRSKIHDPAIVVDTFGVRVGMTLTQAQKAVQERGGFFTDLTFKYNSKHWHHGPAPEVFSLEIRAQKNYDGPMMGVTNVNVYPKDPNASYTDPDNLVVYFVGSGAAGVDFADLSNVSNPKMPKDVMLSKIKAKFPDFIDVQGEKAFQDIKHCYNAEIFVKKVYQMAPYKRAGSKKPLSNRGEDVAAIWRQCGDVLSVDAATQGNKGVHKLIVQRFNYKLMEEAFNNLSQMIGYNEEIKAAVAREK